MKVYCEMCGGMHSPNLNCNQPTRTEEPGQLSRLPYNCLRNSEPVGPTFSSASLRFSNPAPTAFAPQRG